MRVRTDVKIFVCDGKVGEEDLFAITEKTWLPSRRKKDGRKNRGEEDGAHGTPVESAAEAIHGFDSLVMRSEFVLEGLAVVSLEEDI